jgi:glycosyltransferase involved in cell wall biosynthesis
MSNKKRILFFTRPLVPPWDEASKNLAFDIATHISSKDFTAKILTPKKSSFNQSLIKQFSYIQPEEIFRSANLNSYGKIKLIKRLFRFNLKTDLIHFLFTPRPLTSWFFRMRLKFSKVKTLQTIATLSKKNFQKPKKLKKILFADLIVVQSKNTFEKLKKQGLKNIELIYPGINLKKYKPAPKNSSLLKKFNFKKDDFIVLYTGEYTRLKAIDDIMEAIKLLFKEKSNTHNLKFILACRIKSKADKKKKAEITKLLKKENLLKKVTFLDTFNEMEKLYNISDLNIFPAREMAGKFDIPLTLIESMACGKPIIVSKLKNLKEIVGKNNYGLTCKTKSSQDLANKINLLKTNKKLYNKLSKNSIEFIRGNFDLKKTVKEYNKLYKKLLNV